MDIQDLGALGELIGSIAVVVTLIYLVKQIRHNTDETQISNSSVFLERQTSLVTPMAIDKEFCEQWLRAGSHFDELDEVEQQQFILYEWRALSTWSHFYQLHKKGLIADFQWHELLWNFEQIGQRGSIRAAWRVFREAYEPEFRAFMDGYLGENSANGK